MFIWQTGLEKNFFGNHPVSGSTESRNPPPAFASDALINVSSSSHTQEGKNLPDGYSLAGSETNPQIDVPASAGNYMKTSSPEVRHSFKNMFSSSTKTSCRFSIFASMVCH